MTPQAQQDSQPSLPAGAAGDGTDGPPISRRLAQRIATRLYGSPARLRWVRSDEVDVFVAEYGGEGGRGDRVIKIDRQGKQVVAQEQRLLPYLRARGVEVPTIEEGGVEPLGDAEALAAETGPAESVAYVVQPFLRRRGIGAIYGEDVAAARDVAVRLGTSVARLHAVPVAEVPGGWSAEGTRRWIGGGRRGQHERYAAFLGERPVYARLCARAQELLERLPTHFGNGQGYQSLFDGRGAFAIIDWGTSGVYWRLYDLAQGVGAMRVWCMAEPPPPGSGLTEEQIAGDLVPRVLAAYRAEAGALSEDELDELALWRAHQAVLSAASHEERGVTARVPQYLRQAEEALAERPSAVGTQRAAWLS